MMSTHGSTPTASQPQSRDRGKHLHRVAGSHCRLQAWLLPPVEEQPALRVGGKKEDPKSKRARKDDKKAAKKAEKKAKKAEKKKAKRDAERAREAAAAVMKKPAAAKASVVPGPKGGKRPLGCSMCRYIKAGCAKCRGEPAAKKAK